MYFAHSELTHLDALMACRNCPCNLPTRLLATSSFNWHIFNELRASVTSSCDWLTLPMRKENNISRTTKPHYHARTHTHTSKQIMVTCHVNRIWWNLTSSILWGVVRWEGGRCEGTINKHTYWRHGLASPGRLYPVWISHPDPVRLNRPFLWLLHELIWPFHNLLLPPGFLWQAGDAGQREKFIKN